MGPSAPAQVPEGAANKSVVEKADFLKEMFPLSSFGDILDALERSGEDVNGASSLLSNANPGSNNISTCTSSSDVANLCQLFPNRANEVPFLLSKHNNDFFNTLEYMLSFDEPTTLGNIISFSSSTVPTFVGSANEASVNLSTSGTVQCSTSSAPDIPGRRPCRCQQCGTEWPALNNVQICPNCGTAYNKHLRY